MRGGSALHSDTEINDYYPHFPPQCCCPYRWVFSYSNSRTYEVQFLLSYSWRVLILKKSIFSLSKSKSKSMKKKPSSLYLTKLGNAILWRSPIKKNRKPKEPHLHRSNSSSRKDELDEKSDRQTYKCHDKLDNPRLIVPPETFERGQKPGWEKTGFLKGERGQKPGWEKTGFLGWEKTGFLGWQKTGFLQSFCLLFKD